MRKFVDYYFEQEMLKRVDGMGQQINTPVSGVSDEGKMSAFKIAMNKYPEEVGKFLGELGEKDEEIKDALKTGEQFDGPFDHNKDKRKDDVMPATADGSNGIDAGESGE